MDDVRLTPAERRALEKIESELRKDRDLDRAMRRMRLPRTGGRRPLRRHRGDRQGAEPPGTPRGDTPGGEGTANAPGDSSYESPFEGPNASPNASPYGGPAPAGTPGRRAAGPPPDRTPTAHGDRRRVWALALVLSVVFAALLSAGTVFFLVFALVVATIAASAGVVWMCVSFYLRRPGTG